MIFPFAIHYQYNPVVEICGWNFPCVCDLNQWSKQKIQTKTSSSTLSREKFSDQPKQAPEITGKLTETWKNKHIAVPI